MSQSRSRTPSRSRSPSEGRGRSLSPLPPREVPVFRYPSSRESNTTVHRRGAGYNKDVTSSNRGFRRRSVHQDERKRRSRKTTTQLYLLCRQMICESSEDDFRRICEDIQVMQSHLENATSFRNLSTRYGSGYTRTILSAFMATNNGLSDLIIDRSRFRERPNGKWD